MSRQKIALALTLFLALGTSPILAQDKPKNFLSILQVGQTVVLKENAGRYEITVTKDIPLGHTVIEIGSDFVVLEDAAKVTQTIIPVYSIKAIVRLKIPKE